MTATSGSTGSSPATARTHAAWLECGAARFEVRVTALDSERCELWAESCCCSRLREGSAVALEVPPPLSGAGLLRLAGRVSQRDEAPAEEAQARERIRIEFVALASAQRLALASALPCGATPSNAELRRAA